MTGKRLVLQMLTLLGLMTLMLMISIILPGWVRADENITLNKSPDQVVVREGTASFMLTLTNTSGITLTNVAVSDDSCDSITNPTGDTNGDDILDPTETWTYTCTDNVVSDSYTNTATVNGERGDDGTPVSDSDSATVTVADFDFEKTTDTPTVLINSDVVFTLTLDNSGDVDLVPQSGEDPLCDDPNFLSNPSGDLDGDFILDTNEIWTVNCTVPNVTIDFTNMATVTFAAAPGVQIERNAQASVNVVDPSIQITKNPDTQIINSGQPATFDITVQNTSDDPLTNIVVTDAQATDCNNNYSQIGAGGTRNYSCTVDDVREGFINSATVSGTPLVGPDVTDSDAAEVLLTDVVAACPTDMAAYWKLDETGGASYDDYYSGHNGICAGNCPTSLLKGRVNGAQTFDGDTTGIDVPVILGATPFNWGANDSFSIEVWMKGVPGQTCAGPGIPNNEVIVGRDDDPNSDLHWWLGCLNTTGKTRFRLGNTTGDYVSLEGPLINDGTWHHLVALRDGINGVNRLYVDGVEVDSAPKTYTAGFDSASAALNIGWLNLDNGFHFEGQLDEVALYNRSLSPSEIESHYNNGIPGPGYCGGPYAPTIISTPLTTAEPEEPYTYTVEAVGDPNPTYALTVTPTGMTINSTTGEITWTPTSEQVGVHDVQVEARNSAGTDLQDFVIGVSSSAGNNRVYLPIITR